MKHLLYKEFRLSASPLTFLFIAFALMLFIPNYPILVSTFFIGMGMFYTFQFARESNDTVFTALLPVKKSDVVRARYLFCGVIEMVSLVLMVAISILRCGPLANVEPYNASALAVPNCAFIGYALISFTIFNSVFVGGFYKTAYSYGKPFIVYCILVFLFISITEAAHFFPGCGDLNTYSVNTLQIIILALGIVIFAVGTFASCKRACKNFEMTDIK